VELLILTLAIGTWVADAANQQPPRRSPWWPAATLIWVCCKARSVLDGPMKLTIVTLHLLGGLVLLALLRSRWHMQRARPLCQNLSIGL
jgi:cytochrome c oxidase assembly protein subunit 15